MNEILAHYERCFAASKSRTAGDALWLEQLREEAARRFLELGFPTAKLEEWRHTNPAALSKTPFTPLETSAPANVDAIQALAAALPSSVAHVFVDGRRSEQRPQDSDGVEVLSLAELRETSPERLEGKLGRLSDGSDSKDNALAALNTAMLDDGAAVIAARNQAARTPIHLQFASRRDGDTAPLSSPRLLVVAEPGSQLTIWLDYASLGEGAGLTNAVAEIYCGEDAAVNLVVIQRESTAGLHVGNWFVAQERGSRFASHTFTLAGALVRNDLNATLAGEGADCTLNGLFLGRADQRIDNHTHVDHAVPHCTSHELYKGVLGGKSRGVFRGRVLVRPDAQKTSAEQNNANLIVSAGAEIDTKPQLEIYADDVRCSHGSTVGQLDPDAVFYLRARGIGEAEARDLLTRAFAEELVLALPNEETRAAASALVESALRDVAADRGDR